MLGEEKYDRRFGTVLKVVSCIRFDWYLCNSIKILGSLFIGK